MGLTTVVEMKTEMGRLSKIQIKRLAEWKAAGAVCIVSTDPNVVYELIRDCESNWP